MNESRIGRADDAHRAASVRVVLASQSPRRRELLALVGIAHEVRPADVDESVLPGELPVPHCERLARLKAETLAGRDPDAVVIGSDTIVVIDGDILGKPRDAADATTMLRRLSGRTHTVFTAVAVSRGGETRSGVEEVDVTFRTLDDATIEGYIATGEPMDKAGAYGVQGYGATIVERVEGDYFAVMGLPMGRLVALLRDAGLAYRFGPLTAA
ncbi:MAG TPA: Maf family protein [Gemmatimonas sp.]|nr:Maf family protein [Gemmatimonas sp.]